MTTRFDVPALPFPVEAELTLPGSKSHANRAIVCACLAGGETIIRNATPCDDVLVMVENLQKMGFQIEWRNREAGELKIVGTPNPSPEPGVVLDCHNAGTALRFLLSVAALVPGDWILTGDEHMRKRPIADLTAALRSLGADISDTNGCPPIRVCGGGLKGSVVRLKASVSSQYLTSLLLIAPFLPNGLKIELDGPIASESYIDLTEKVMDDFGVKIEKNLNIFIVQKGTYSLPINSSHPLTPSPNSGEGGAHTFLNTNLPLSGSPERGVPQDGARAFYDIEGDWSAAGSWLVLNELTGSRIRCVNLHDDSTQADRHLPEMIQTLRRRGDITIDCSLMPDQVMNLAVLSAFRSGTTTMTGIANLRHKECDRLAVITSELRKVGINIIENEEGLVLQGNNQFSILNSQSLDPHNDHRMAICFAILGLKTGSITIANPECVQKSYPQFFKHLQAIRSCSRPIVIVGMRGAGKSSLARRLAAALKCKCSDSDRVFVERNGPIKEFIAARGWSEFRAKEEELISDLLHAGTVISLGGGATESEKTRSLLKKKCIVIWVQATKAELLQRLESGKRPAITDLPLHEEVHKLLVERAPNYKDVAHIMIPPKLRYSAQVPFAVAALQALVSKNL